MTKTQAWLDSYPRVWNEENRNRKFWARVNKNGPNGCWVFVGSDRTKTGHIRIRIRGKRKFVHRHSWELSKGPIPNNLCCLHECDNPPCVNPDHLFLGTRGDNNTDCMLKGRTAKGDKNGTHTRPETRSRGDAHYARTNPERLAHGTRHGNAILTPAKIRRIRKLIAEGLVQREIAAIVGTERSNISYIKHNKGWKHVK